MRDELLRLSVRVKSLMRSVRARPTDERERDRIEAELRSLAERLPTEKEVMTNAPEIGRPVAPPPSNVGGGDTDRGKVNTPAAECSKNGETLTRAPELHTSCWEIRWPSGLDGFEEVRYGGTNAVQDYRDHVHPEARSRELVYKDEAIAYAGARVAAETAALRDELAEEKRISAAWCAQAEEAERERDEARAAASETNATISRIYEKIPSLPLSAESLDAATDAVTAFCFMVGALGLDPDAILADRGGES